RPRIEDAEALRTMVENGLFERTLRQEAANPAIERRPEVAAVLADRIEFHSVNNYLQQEVVAKIPTDSVTLKRYYQAHHADFDRPAPAAVVPLLFGERRSADSLARQFTIPGNAESLAVQAQRGGLNYAQMVTAQSDSALFKRTRAMGAGAVAVDSLTGAWRVFKVLSVDARTPQPFGAVRAQVAR